MYAIYLDEELFGTVKTEEEAMEVSKEFRYDNNGSVVFGGYAYMELNIVEVSVDTKEALIKKIHDDRIRMANFWKEVLADLKEAKELLAEFDLEHNIERLKSDKDFANSVRDKVAKDAKFADRIVICSTELVIAITKDIYIVSTIAKELYPMARTKEYYYAYDRAYDIDDDIAMLEDRIEGLEVK